MPPNFAHVSILICEFVILSEAKDLLSACEKDHPLKATLLGSMLVIRSITGIMTYVDVSRSLLCSEREPAGRVMTAQHGAEGGVLGKIRLTRSKSLQGRLKIRSS